jgi:thymidylate synthase
MNKLDKQYTDLLQTILDHGVEKKDRTGTGTISIFGYTIRHKMSDGFPLLTTKKMYIKGIVTELLWFLRGDTNIKFLVDNDCHIWNGDAYKNYLKHTITGVENGLDRIAGYMDGCLVEFDGHYEHFTNPSFAYGFRPHTQEEFIDKIKTDEKFAQHWGDLGPIYGKQWRSWAKFNEQVYTKQIRETPKDGGFSQTRNISWVGGSEVAYIDQIQNLINDLKTNPNSRRLMVTAWNPGELNQMILPPCHYGFQCYTRELSYKERYDIWFSNNYETGMEKDYNNKPNFDDKYYEPTPTRALSLMWNQRSVDTFLGLPFNIASYGLLLEILSKIVNMVPDQLIGNLGDVHLYNNHVEQAKEQIGRRYTPQEREDMLKEAMGEENYKKSIKELVPFGGGMSGYYDYHEIPYRTREPFYLPKLEIQKTNAFWKEFEVNQFNHLDLTDFIIEKYRSHPAIKAPLSN